MLLDLNFFIESNTVFFMKIFKMNPSHPDKKLIDKAIDIMADGGVILYPTDTVYGLGANIFNNDAVKRIYEIKQRESDKPLSILLSDVENIPLVAQASKKQMYIVNNWLPGPYTFILPKRGIVSSFVSSNAKVGIRVPDYEIATELASIFPIVTTSANVADQETLSNPQDILKQIGDDVDLVIDVGELGDSNPSTIIDLSMPHPSLVRSGLIADKINDFKENGDEIDFEIIKDITGINDLINLIEGLLLKGNTTLIEILEKLGIKDILEKISGLGLENISFSEFEKILNDLSVREIKKIMDALRAMEKEK